ncbi:hypothetical protein [Nitratireductor sp. L15S-10]|uniref:hypothetical protein n=1 Tax=Nitratireductor sp. L15S-10 TaxID=3034028 RepID=UPI0038575E20
MPRSAASMTTGLDGTSTSSANLAHDGLAAGIRSVSASRSPHLAATGRPDQHDRVRDALDVLAVGHRGVVTASSRSRASSLQARTIRRRGLRNGDGANSLGCRRQRSPSSAIRGRHLRETGAVIAVFPEKARVRGRDRWPGRQGGRFCGFSVMCSRKDMPSDRLIPYGRAVSALNPRGSEPCWREAPARPTPGLKGCCRLPATVAGSRRRDGPSD